MPGVGRNRARHVVKQPVDRCLLCAEDQAVAVVRAEGERVAVNLPRADLGQCLQVGQLLIHPGFTRHLGRDDLADREARAIYRNPGGIAVAGRAPADLPVGNGGATTSSAFRK